MSNINYYLSDLIIYMPIKSMRKHIISIDSRDRDYSHYDKPNNYVIKLPDVYRNISEASLLNCEVPMSFYIFASYLQNTSLQVSIYDLSQVKTTAVITIPDGNYNEYTLTETLESVLNTAFIGQSVVFTLKLSEATLKLHISNNKGYEIEVNTNGVSPLQRTNWGLGYYLGFYPNSIVKGTTVISPAVVSFNPYTYMFLVIEGLNVIDKCGNTRGTNVAFAKIPLNSNSFEYSYLDRERVSFGDAILNPKVPKLDSLRISWRFHDGKLVEFNGVEHSFSIELLSNDVLV